MNEAYAVLQNVLQEAGLSYSPVPAQELCLFRGAGEHGLWRGAAKIWPEVARFSIYVMLPQRVPAEARPLVAEYLTRVNYELPMGCFVLDYGDGEVRYQHGVSYAGFTLSPQLAHNQLAAALAAADACFPRVLALLHGAQLTPAQAEAFVEAQLRAGLAQTRTALDNLLALQPPPESPAAPEANGRTETITNGRSLAHDLLGFTPTDLEQNPQQVREKIDAFFNALKSFITNVTASDDASLAAARAQLQSFRQTLAQHGIATNEEMASLPDQVNALARQKAADRQAQFAADLQKLAERIRETAVALSAPSPQPADRSTPQ